MMTRLFSALNLLSRQSIPSPIRSISLSVGNLGSKPKGKTGEAGVSEFRGSCYFRSSCSVLLPPEGISSLSPEVSGLENFAGRLMGGFRVASPGAEFKPSSTG